MRLELMQDSVIISGIYRVIHCYLQARSLHSFFLRRHTCNVNVKIKDKTEIFVGEEVTSKPVLLHRGFSSYKEAMDCS